MAVEKRLGLHHVPQRDTKLPGAEKGPKTQVPPAGFLRPGIRRHKGPAGRGPRWQGQGLSRRRNALRPPRAERGPLGVRVAGLSGQAPYTWGPGSRGSVSARGDPRTLPGRAPVPRLYQANTIVQARNPSSVCDRRRIGHGKVPSRTFYRCLSPRRAERRDPGRGERTRAQPSPPGEARGPGPPRPSRSGRRAPRGGGLGQVGPGPHSPGTPGRPPPEASESSFSPSHRLRTLRRGPAGCWAAVSFLLTSGAASRGRGRHYLHKGRAGPERRAPAAPPPGPGPASGSPRPSRRGPRAGALGGAGPRSGQSAAPSARGRGPSPREYARGAVGPPPASPARTLGRRTSAPRPVSRRLPEEEIVPGTRACPGLPPRTGCRGERSLPRPGPGLPRREGQSPACSSSCKRPTLSGRGAGGHRAKFRDRELGALGSGVAEAPPLRAGPKPEPSSESSTAAAAATGVFSTTREGNWNDERGEERGVEARPEAWAVDGTLHRTV